MEDVNRIKLVLVEKKRTSKWLAEQLGVNPVYELFPTRPCVYIKDCRSTGSRPKRTLCERVQTISPFSGIQEK